MNRAARRRAQRGADKLPTYNVNQSQIKDLVTKELEQQMEEVEQLAISMTTAGVTAAFIIALHDEFGFGIKRLEKILDNINSQFEAIEGGYITVEDMLEWCYDYGIDIQGGHKGCK